MDPFIQRSEEVQEYLGRMPSSWVRYGTIFIGFALMVLLVLGAMVSWPDAVEAPLVISSASPPVEIVAKVAGQLEKQWVAEGDSVVAGQLLVTMDGGASIADVALVEQDITSLLEFEAPALMRYTPRKNLKLGPIAIPYQAFVQSSQTLTFETESDNEGQNTGALRRQISDVRSAIQQLQDKQKLVIKELEVAQKASSAAEDGYADKLYSYVELAEARSNVLKKKQEIKDISYQINREKEKIGSYNIDIQRDRQGAKSGELSNFFEVQKQMLLIQESIKVWKQDNQITAPIAGTVTYYNGELQKGEPVEAKAVLLSIIPFQKSKSIHGEMKIPTENAGRVELKQKVLVSFSQFPHQDYGWVEGKIASKSNLPRNNQYFVEVDFPKGLVTTFGETLEFKLQMEGKAKIILEEKSLNRRLFQKVYDVFGW